MSLSFARLATVSASTKRSAGIVNGIRSDPVAYLLDVPCMPLDPITPEIALRPGLDLSQELLVTFVDKQYDIKEGDYLVVGSKEYPVRSVAEWEWRRSIYRQLVLEDIKS